MNCYSIEPRDQIFVKRYGFWYFSKNMKKTIGKNISIILSGKYSQKLLDHAKESETGAFNTVSKRNTQETRETTGDFIGNKTADKISDVSRSPPQNSLETVESETENIGFDRERCISAKKCNKLLISRY